MRSESRKDRQDDRWAGVLQARPGGPADRFAGMLGDRHPALVFFAALLSAFAVLVAVSLAVGYVATRMLLDDVSGLRAADNGAIRQLVSERSGFLDTVSMIGSTVGGAPVLPILVGLVAIVCAFRKRWLIAAFAVFVLSIESATYRVTSLVLPRQRPSVPRLEDLPANASYPSGHTAASIAVYAGLVFLLVSGIGSRGVRIAAWVVAIALPVFVRCDFASDYRHDAQNAEEAGRHTNLPDILRPAGGCHQIHALKPAVYGHVQRAAMIANILPSAAVHFNLFVPASIATVHTRYACQPLRLRVRQRPEQHRVNDAEDRGVGADAQRQRDDHRQRVGRILAEYPEGVTEVTRGGVHPG